MISVLDFRWFREIKYIDWDIRILGATALIYHNTCACESAYSINPSSITKLCFSCNTVIPKELDVIITLLGPYTR